MGVFSLGKFTYKYTVGRGRERKNDCEFKEFQ